VNLKANIILDIGKYIFPTHFFFPHIWSTASVACSSGQKTYPTNSNVLQCV